MCPSAPHIPESDEQPDASLFLPMSLAFGVDRKVGHMNQIIHSMHQCITHAKRGKASMSPISVFKSSAIAATMLVLGVATSLGGPGGVGRSHSPNASPSPAGFGQMLVYLGESVLHPEEPGTLTDLDSVKLFQESIMRRTSAEVSAQKGAAREFFRSRFDLDFTPAANVDPYATEMISGALFFPFVQNPGANYRAYVVSGASVPPEGWMVRDGGWLVMVTEDKLVHGEYGGTEGKWILAGTAFVFGDYNIKVVRPNTKAGPHADEEIVIHYESGGALLNNADGVMVFTCDLTHPEWGSGKARGVVQGKTIRNVLTFPAELP
jgi:hypothetical protein